MFCVEIFVNLIKTFFLPTLCTDCILENVHGQKESNYLMKLIKCATNQALEISVMKRQTLFKGT